MSLIVAQPKSASTSLMEALGGTQEFDRLRRFTKPTKYDKLPHEDIVDLPVVEWAWFVQQDRIFKQHFPPSNQNLDIVTANEFPMVLLLRNPEDSIRSYYHVPNAPYNLTHTVREQLYRWHYTWDSISHKPYVLKITFAQLLNETQETVNSVCEFLGHNRRVYDGFEMPERRVYKTNGSHID